MTNNSKYRELVEACAKQITHGFCVTETGGHLDDLYESLLGQLVVLHTGDLYGIATCREMLEAMADVYKPSSDFTMEDLLKKAFAECLRGETECYEDLIYARAKYRYPTKEIKYDWFYEASGNDLLGAWDDEIYDRLNFKPYEVVDDDLTPQQISEIEEILWRMAIADDPSTVNKEVSVCEDEWWWCEEEISQYIRENQPETFNLKETYRLVVQRIVLGIINQNMETVELNHKIHKGE